MYGLNYRNFLYHISSIIGGAGSKKAIEFFHDGVFDASIEELAVIYLLGFQAALKKTTMACFQRATTARPITFFNAISLTIGTPSTSGIGLDKFLNDHVFQASTKPPHHMKMETWAMLPGPLKHMCVSLI